MLYNVLLCLRCSAETAKIMEPNGFSIHVVLRSGAEILQKACVRVLTEGLCKSLNGQKVGGLLGSHSFYFCIWKGEDFVRMSVDAAISAEVRCFRGIKKITGSIFAEI